MTEHSGRFGKFGFLDDPKENRRILLINGSSRSDQTCPGEMSKSFCLAKIAEPILQGEGYVVDFLDLSRLTSEIGRHIHPCKSCVSTAMPLQGAALAYYFFSLGPLIVIAIAIGRFAQQLLWKHMPGRPASTFSGDEQY